MEVFLNRIPLTAKETDVISAFARVLHSDRYREYSDGSDLINFRVFLHPDKRNHKHAHSGRGSLTIPDIDVASQLLRDHGGNHPPLGAILVKNRGILCEKSKSAARTDILATLKRTPFIEPAAQAEADRRAAALTGGIPISSIQFGWECRDDIFSLEWSRIYLRSSCVLCFEDDRKVLRFSGEREGGGAEVIEIKYSQIKDLSTSDASGEASIFLFLSYPPSFQTEVTSAEDLQAWQEHQRYKNSPQGRRPALPGRRRRSCWDDDHAKVVPFVSTAIRLVCGSPVALTRFRDMASEVGLQPARYDYEIIRRNLFSRQVLKEFEEWLATLAWPIAFHLDEMHKRLLLDTREVLSLQEPLHALIAREGRKTAALVVGYFARNDAPDIPWSDSSHRGQHIEPHETARQRFERRVQESLYIDTLGTKNYSEGVFDCLHVVVTPTCVMPYDIYPDRSNRVLRWFPGKTGNFLRVTYAEEDRLGMRHDKEIDSSRFTDDRLGYILRNGLIVCGRKFEFLAFSQSALKDHAVWMVRPFKDDQGKTVTASRIRKRVGIFPPDVLNCPALYAARISQAFTATDPSVTVTVGEIRKIRDVVHRERDANHKIVLDATGQPRMWKFTDGVGTISPELADQITTKLKEGQKRPRKGFRPRVFQIRIGGAKGMVSVDYRLAGRGRVISLRPSMIKFTAEASRDIEIAQAFHRPTKMMLNRPLIMVLECLGVDGQRFLDLQQDCIAGVQASTQSISSAAAMIEEHGLGASFRLTSVFLGLHKLGLDFAHQDPVRALGGVFMQGLMRYAVNHILREMKHHARIPVPDGYTLVGVADIHNVLRPFQIFCCVQDVEDVAPRYLEGWYIVTRSPVCHPGDVQRVYAIGKPPQDSPYNIEPLINSVVFPIDGPRPLASYLGGGDLDGDEFNLIPAESGLCPSKTYPPASYAPPERKRLDRPSTVNDIVDFVVDYINNDNVGIIASRWLAIADYSRKGIFDERCMKLSEMHSDAVDFPKTGKAVPFTSIPQAEIRLRPDWSAPETVKPGKGYYESTKAIGRLFRAIELPSLEQRNPINAHLSLRTADMDALESAMSSMQLGSDNERISAALRPLLARFIAIESDEDDVDVSHARDVFAYYESRLGTICTVNSISEARRPGARLSEVEVVLGTIAANTSQRRRREQAVAKVREQARWLVDEVLGEFAGDEEEGEGGAAWLARAWTAWRFAASEAEKGTFGATSFGVIALASMFDAVHELEQKS